MTPRQLADAMSEPDGCLVHVDGAVLVGRLAAPVLGGHDVVIDRAGIVRHIIAHNGDRVAAANAITDEYALTWGN